MCSNDTFVKNVGVPPWLGSGWRSEEFRRRGTLGVSHLRMRGSPGGRAFRSTARTAGHLTQKRW